MTDATVLETLTHESIMNGTVLCSTKHSEVKAMLAENQILEERLQQLQKVLIDLYMEGSRQKMKNTILIGGMKLEVDSLREDRQFLIEKYRELKIKIEESKNDLIAMEDETNFQKAPRRERRNSI
ncbi:hypothetical protein IV203_029828 [Nitzschia inconspicua]|uniref:Uncharacterized protein n=1 Tax=Nitzschia inconspicua TaxID=303405 RepID=A0A9K3LSF9_9STRA|nr:hypothetical protein IV203_029828 [Nitzschia inconspicua]